MSLPRQTLTRLPKIKAGLIQGYNIDDIAKECGVTEKTIDRDLQKWLRSGDFEIWLRSEWIRYHVLVGHMDPIEVYRQLSKLVGKQIAQKISAEVREKAEITLNVKVSPKLIKDDTSTTSS